MITNPVLRGFRPDPSILRVKDDYYIATSTFEWFPGVLIHHSRDLVHWRPVARPLNRVSQLDLKGVSNSGGVWAPCLSYDRGLFYLVYTNGLTFDQKLFCFDAHNYVVTTRDVCARWSEPVYLNSSGFDPSLFHDDDGRKWLVNMVWDHRKGVNHFGGILLQEYSPKKKMLVGPIRNIFKGTPLGITEGPHLYKRNGTYYLITAEGGTSYHHAVTVARSRRITGPYEVDPENPILTSRDDPALELQKAGHASLVETQNHEWYLAFLCGRPLTPLGRCPLGRETALEKVVWTKDGWLRPWDGVKKPGKEVPSPDLPQRPWPKEKEKDDFDSRQLSIHFCMLRMPLGENELSLKERPGYLRLKGGSFLNSMHKQSFVARRREAFCFAVSTRVDITPGDFQHMAGLVVFYDTKNFMYLRISRDEDRKVLGIIACEKGECRYVLDNDIVLGKNKRHYLRVECAYEKLQFYDSADARQWRPVGPVLDSSKLSDEYVDVNAFTGTFVGLCCQDLSGAERHADFDSFEYVERNSLLK